MYIIITNNQNEFTLEITPVYLRHVQNAETPVLMFSTAAIYWNINLTERAASRHSEGYECQ
jgi:hypothetical protein